MSIWVAVILALVLVGTASTAIRIRSRAQSSGSPAGRAFGAGLLVVSVGYFGWVARATAAGRISVEPLFWLTLGAHFVVAIGVGMLFVGVWRFYRPDSVLAGAGALLGTSVVAGSWALQAMSGAVMELNSTDLAPTLFISGQAAVMLWWGIESLRYYGQMQRRVALDMAEPLVADRFRVMAHATLSLAVVFTLCGLCPWIFGQSPREVPIVIGAVAVATTYGAFCLVCALLCPTFYASRVLAKSAQSTG